MTRRGALSGASLAVAICMVAIPAAAQVMKQDTGGLEALAKADSRLFPAAASALIDDVQGLVGRDVADGWAAFGLDHGAWVGYVDQRTGRLEYAEGGGIAWVPGRGNSLAAGDIAGHLRGKAQPDLAVLESIAREFLPQVAGIMGVDPSSLVLNAGRSGERGGYLWFVDFDVVVGGLPVEGARVVFRVNHGNLIQLGSENLPAAGARAPRVAVGRDQALAAVADYIGGVYPTDDFIDQGTLKLFPAESAGASLDDSFAAAGRGLIAVWELVFRREGDHGTWRARVDAASGEVVEFADTNLYGQATGGVYLIQPSGGSVNMPMPFADVATSTFANSAGIFSSGTDSNLSAQFVRISDNCGSIQENVNGSGDIAFGTSGGDDCTTPGHGGAGNTHSSRTQFYHLNRIKEVGRGWLSSSWLSAQLTANVNINQNCNAFWNGSTVNFYRSGSGCGNTGELPGVSLHEYGHGLDSNDGNGSANHDQGTGETYGDFTAALQLHQSCIGAGFLGGNCGGYGDACTSCTGVRDIDWAKHVSNTPHTVANFTQPRCPTSATYRGPCGREGHCESYVSSEALWDLAARDMPSPGSGSAWSAVDRLWYLSRSTATVAFVCTASGTWSSHGCATGTLWRTMRAVDDDDGNLTNGTPHGGALFAAFNRHLIACTTDAGASTTFRGCTPPSTPSLTLTPGGNSMGLSWSSSGSVVYDVYRSELGCNAGFTKIANNVSGTSFNDTGVANGFTYSYQVVAHPSTNEACGGTPSTCQSATPTGGACTPPAAPSGLSATAVSQTQVNLSWSAVSGASSYNVYRSTTSGGPYTSIGSSTTTSFSDTSASCNTTYFYVVRAVSGACESGNSNQASATTSACTGCTTTTLYTNNFQSGSGLVGWTRGSFGGSGSVVSWRGRQTCSGAGIFRYGGSSCTSNYGSNNFNFAQPPVISVPAGSTQTTLSFTHRRQFETGFDGGLLTLSLDGSNYEVVPSTSIGGTNYNGTVAPDCAPAGGSAGLPIYTGTQTSFTSTTVNLESVCNLIGAGGCAGQSLRIGFTAVTDCTVTADGWFLDNVTVTACVP